ncbi:MAG: hypothetical protein WD607_11250 [Candidatus Paceibacterota bacterium]
MNKKIFIILITTLLITGFSYIQFKEIRKSTENLKACNDKVSFSINSENYELSEFLSSLFIKKARALIRYDCSFVKQDIENHYKILHIGNFIILFGGIGTLYFINKKEDE